MLRHSSYALLSAIENVKICPFFVLRRNSPRRPQRAIKRYRLQKEQCVVVYGCKIPERQGLDPKLAELPKFFKYGEMGTEVRGQRSLQG